MKNYITFVNEFLNTVFEKTEDEQVALATKILKKMGSDRTPQLLGEGGFGSAFAIGDKVLKVTRDTGEAANAVRSMKANLKHVVKYYAAYRLLFDENVSDERLQKLTKRGLYVLVLDKLKTFKSGGVLSKLLNGFMCPSDAGDLQNRYANFNSDKYTLDGKTGDWDFEKFKKANPIEKVCDRAGVNVDNETKNLYAQLVELMGETMKAKINLVDMDYGNLGLTNDNTLVVFDMGGIGSIDKGKAKEILSTLKPLEIEGDMDSLFKAQGTVQPQGGQPQNTGQAQ